MPGCDTYPEDDHIKDGTNHLPTEVVQVGLLERDSRSIWGFPKMGLPNSWMVYSGNPFKMDDLGVSVF